jgi:hypothetical protein
MLKQKKKQVLKSNIFHKVAYFYKFFAPIEKIMLTFVTL